MTQPSSGSQPHYPIAGMHIPFSASTGQRPACESSLSCILGSHKKGPPGCNVFVFHLPHNYSHLDLYSLFAPFGNILSTKVSYDETEQRGLSFGIVSFDNPLSAQYAIGAINGLKVTGEDPTTHLTEERTLSAALKNE